MSRGIFRGMLNAIYRIETGRSIMTTHATRTDKFVTRSLPRLLLHLEGLTVFLAAIALYITQIQGAWWLFLLLLFLPDISMLGYALNPKLGAITYYKRLFKIKTFIDINRHL
jgi:hypothetical protein